MGGRVLFHAVLIGSMLLASGCSDSPKQFTEEERRALERDVTEEPAKQAAKGEPALRQKVDAPPSEGAFGITPQNPTAADTLRVSYPSGVDKAEDIVQWYLNGALLDGYSSASFNLKEAGIKKGDTVHATLFASGTELRSNEVKLENAPPVIVSLRLQPAVFKPGDKISALVESEDADGDNVELKYAWTLNGMPAGTDMALGATIKRGDEFKVSVIPYDGLDYGTEEYLTQDVGNVPPMIDGHYEYKFDGSTYTYQTRASDPDGDALTFSLSAGPEGMEINPATGAVRWSVPLDFVGTADFVIVVEDGSGGSSQMEQSFRITQ